MLEITVRPQEYYDEASNQIITVNEQKIVLEHSLISLSKWESKWHKAFLDDKPGSIDEQIDYIRCMTINKGVDPLAYYGLTNKQMSEINAYITDSMTATTFNDINRKYRKKRITNEVIYSWMFDLGIPIECEKWHLNRLLTLIRVCNDRHAPKKKMSRRETFDRYAEINARNRKRFGTNG